MCYYRRFWYIVGSIFMLNDPYHKLWCLVYYQWWSCNKYAFYRLIGKLKKSTFLMLKRIEVFPGSLIWSYFTRKSYRLSIWLVLWHNGLGKYLVCKRFAVQTLLSPLEFVLQRNLKHNTIAVWTLTQMRYYGDFRSWFWFYL